MRKLAFRRVLRRFLDEVGGGDGFLNGDSISITISCAYMGNIRLHFLKEEVKTKPYRHDFLGGKRFKVNFEIIISPDATDMPGGDSVLVSENDDQHLLRHFVKYKQSVSLAAGEESPAE